MKAYQFVTSVSVASTLKIKVNESAILLHWHIMKNGAIQATYSLNGKNCSTFISQKSVAYGAVKVMAERAKEVELKVPQGLVVGHYVIKKGLINYSCNYKSCTCPSFAVNQLDQVLGFKLCKHVIASAKRDRIAFSLNELSSVILGK